MIVVVGSAGMDLTALVDHLPDRGETVVATRYLTAPGAKGANQAVAAARAGAVVHLVGRVGRDEFGGGVLASLRGAGVDIERVALDEAHPTTVALIWVEPSGENAIVVTPGANRFVGLGDVDAAGALIEEADLLLVQLEIPSQSVVHAARLARAAGTRVILNPSPVDQFDAELLSLSDVLVLNEVELAQLSGLGSPIEEALAARMLVDQGCPTVIVTLGAQGSLIVAGDDETEILAYPVEAVDSTGAGDAYLGNLAAAIDAGESLVQAARFASAAAALSVTVPGAQPSMPRREQTLALMREGIP